MASVRPKSMPAEEDPVYLNMEDLSPCSPEDPDPSSTDGQRRARQMRQLQVEQYLERERRHLAVPTSSPRRQNRRHTQVHFGHDVCLQAAAEVGDVKEARQLLERGADVNFKTGNSTSLLHKSCAEGYYAMAELLIQNGCDVNSRDDDWWTPLHVTAYQDNADIIHLLLANGAEVTSQDVDGNFALDHAAKDTDTWEALMGSLEGQGLSEVALRTLKLKRGRQLLDVIRVKIKTRQDLNEDLAEDGVTAIHVAAANGYVKCGALLLLHGVDLTVMTQASGWTPLHCAAKFGQTRMVKLLIHHGADVNTVDKGGNTPLDLATEEDVHKLIQEAVSAARQSALMAAGADNSAVEAEQEEEEEESYVTKIVRPPNLPLSKADQMMEGQQLRKAREHLSPSPASAGKGQGEVAASAVEEDEKYEELKLDSLNRRVYSALTDLQGTLPNCSLEDDLSNLPLLTERTILDTVIQRFKGQQIYTYMGEMLIALNPFSTLPYYGPWASQLYREASSMTSLPPHVYAVAERALRQMRTSGSGQCCVIVGESGAGKTETAKLLVQHLVGAASSNAEHQLSVKLHQINPLLEAFGNAKTTMNDNSSRFAKYLELVFSPSGAVLGGEFCQYLLEKSRVVNRSPGEGNFHIFSWLVHGASPEVSTQCMLDKTVFRYLQSAPNIDVENAHQKLQQVKDCLMYVGFSQDEVTHMLGVIASVLHLGEIEFITNSDGHAVTVVNPEVLINACQLLGVSITDMTSALTEDVIAARGEELRRPLTVEQCVDNLLALSKAIYSRLFAWTVNGANEMVAPLEEDRSERRYIGVLDIFGFEHLERNGFEQMCINLANERLQQFYQQQVFEQQRQDCLAEGVKPTDVTWPSTQAVLDLFMEKNRGVYDLLDEESAFPKASDGSLATKLHSYLGKKYERVYKAPKGGGKNFTVVHYAGAVTYDLQGVLHKNRDTLRNGLAFVMRGSSSLLVRELFKASVTKTGSILPSARQRLSRKTKPSNSPLEFFRALHTPNKEQKGAKKSRKRREDKGEGGGGRAAASRKMPSTLTFHFKNSLKEMLSKLESSAPHFIRCIKPNGSSRPLQADCDYVKAQLSYSGVLQTVVLCKEGYPVRCTAEQFAHRYAALVALRGRARTPTSDLKACVQNALTVLKIPRSQMGPNKVFLKGKEAMQLDEINQGLLKQIIQSQSAVRRFLARRLAERTRTARATFLRELKLQKEMERKRIEEEGRRKRAKEEEGRRKREKEEEAKKKKDEGKNRHLEIERLESFSGESTMDSIRSGASYVSMHRKEDDMVSAAPDVRQSLLFLESMIDEFLTEDLGLEGSELEVFYDKEYHDDTSAIKNADNRSSSSPPYENIASLRQLTNDDRMHRKHHSHNNNTSSSNNNHIQYHQQYQQQPATCYPHDVVLDPSWAGTTAYPPTPREMYGVQNGHQVAGSAGHQIPGMCGRRMPPPLPERSPDTHLSTSSRKSSVSSKDSVSSADFYSELNEVFEPSNYHQHQQQAQPHQHHPHPSLASPTSPPPTRYADSRPFSYAAGVDAKALQQHRQNKPRAASESFVAAAVPGAGGVRGCEDLGLRPNGGVSKSAGDCTSRGDSLARTSFHPQDHYRRGSSDSGGGGGGPVRGGAVYVPPPVLPPAQHLQQAAVAPPATDSSQAGPYLRSQTAPHPVTEAPHPGRGQGPGGCQVTGYQYPPHSPTQGPAAPQPWWPAAAGCPPQQGAAVQASAVQGVPNSPRHRPGPAQGAVNGQPPVLSPASTRRSTSGPVPPSSLPPPPPTFPAPPPPLMLHDRYLTVTSHETRSPSPPLPPPPPAAAGGAVQVIKGLNSAAVGARVTTPESPGIARKGGRQPGSDAPSSQSPNPSTILAELSQAKLRKASNDVEPRSRQPPEEERSLSPLGVRLKSTSGKFSNIYQEGTEEPHVVPSSQEMQLPEDVDLPPPPPPPALESGLCTSVTPACPPTSLSMTSGAIPEGQLAAAIARMEIDIPDDIDLSQCPGLVEINKSTPNWKRDMIEKKNKEKIEEYVKAILKQREQEAKWRNVPEWKRALLMKKDQEDAQAALGSTSPIPEKKAASTPKVAPVTPPKVASGDQPSPKPKCDIVPAALGIDPAEFESMPPWKKELLMKRDKLPPTFGNEFNPEDGGETAQS